MSIILDTPTVARLLDLVMPGAGPSPTETRGVLQIAQLAAGIDLEDDDAERGLLGALSLHLCAVAGIPVSSVPVLSPLPGDPEERRSAVSTLARRLVTTGARELSYIVAYLLIVADLELAPVEGELLEELRSALGIEPDQADELAAGVAALVTPGVRGEPPGAPAQL